MTGATRSARPSWPACLGFALALALVLVPGSTASARVLWRGGFEDGTRAEFGRYHAVPANPPRISVVEKPVADGLNVVGEKAARVEVRTGDDARKLDPVTGALIGSNDYNERAELLPPYGMLGHEFFREGDDLWFSWNAMFPTNGWWGTDLKGGGTIFWQLHHVKLSNDTYAGSPPLMFQADNETLYVTQCLAYLCAETRRHYAGPLRRDHWYQFVLHIRNSADPAKGQLELWIDGSKKIDARVALLFGADFANYVATGQYRRPGTPRTGVLYADNYVVGTTQADVTPEPPPPSPPPETAPPTDPEPPSDPSDPDPTQPAPPVAPGDDDPIDNESPEPAGPAREEPVPGAAGEVRVSAGPACSQVDASRLGVALCGLVLLRRRTRRRCPASGRRDA